MKGLQPRLPRARCLGPIGGLGVGATVHYYRALAKAHAVRGVAMRLVMEHVDTGRVFELMQTGDRAGLAHYLADSIARLHAAGAEIAAVPAVAPHPCARELVAISPIPIVNLLDVVRREVRASGIRRGAIFGTRLAMDTGAFGAFAPVELVTLKPEDRDYVHETYLSLALSGERSEEHYRGLTTLAHTLLRAGAERIILAGTNLSVIFDEDTTEFPHIDCARLYINAIVHALIEP